MARWLSLLPLLLLAACGRIGVELIALRGDAGSPRADAAADGGGELDAGSPYAGMDAATANDAGQDAELPEPPMDAATPMDAGTDAQPMLDANMNLDAATDAEHPLDAGENDAGPLNEFGYVPTNFDPLTLPSSSDDLVLNCGTSQFNSSTLAYSNWCGQVMPTPVVRAQSSGPALVIVVVRSITLATGSTLRLIGNRPVVFAVRGDATFDGDVNASATGTTPGAGGNQSCGSSAGGNGSGDSSTGGGGGGGGGFGTSGGKGGYGDVSGNEGAPGIARGNASLSPLLGGCAGGTGGGCSGAGGGAGGAIQVSAAGHMSVSGNWQALGATGTNGCGSEGGGFGGGSGGAMLLEADTLEVFSPATLRANGGNGGNSQGNGGSGGTSTQTAQPGGNGLANGGGGGGGAVGRIRLRAGTSCTIAGTFSPSPSRSCP